MSMPILFAVGADQVTLWRVDTLSPDQTAALALTPSGLLGLA
jgi:hypothetical protein